MLNLHIGQELTSKGGNKFKVADFSREGNVVFLQNEYGGLALFTESEIKMKFEFTPEPWKPKFLQDYKFINSFGEIETDEWNELAKSSESSDEIRYRIGNCFPLDHEFPEDLEKRLQEFYNSLKG